METETLVLLIASIMVIIIIIYFAMNGLGTIELPGLR
jgi:hypothetical protein